MEVVKHDILTLPERGRRITDAFAFIPNRAVNLAVPKTGTAKILYMRGFRLFAMYVRTEPVHTYIAKSPKHAIYAILYDDKVVPVNLTSTTQVHPSCHSDNSVLMALDKMSSATEDFRKL